MSLHCWAQTLRHNLRSVKLPMEYELNYIHDTWYLLHPPQFEATNHAHTAKLNEAYIEHIEKGRFGWHHKAWTDLWRSSCLWSSFSEHSKFFLQQLLNLSLLVSQRDIILLVTGVSWVKYLQILFFFSKMEETEPQLQLPHQGWIRSKPFVQESCCRPNLYSSWQILIRIYVHANLRKLLIWVNIISGGVFHQLISRPSSLISSLLLQRWGQFLIILCFINFGQICSWFYKYTIQKLCQITQAV